MLMRRIGTDGSMGHMLQENSSLTSPLPLATLTSLSALCHPSCSSHPHLSNAMCHPHLPNALWCSNAVPLTLLTPWIATGIGCQL